MEQRVEGAQWSAARPAGHEHITRSVTLHCARVEIGAARFVFVATGTDGAPLAACKIPKVSEYIARRLAEK